MSAEKQMLGEVNSVHRFATIHWSMVLLAGRCPYQMRSPVASIAHSTQTASGKWFATTHWSAVLQAGAGASPASQKALELLCRRYWPAVFTYLRGCGFSSSDAEDLTQSYFVH